MKLNFHQGYFVNVVDAHISALNDQRFATLRALFRFLVGLVVITVSETHIAKVQIDIPFLVSFIINNKCRQNLASY